MHTQVMHEREKAAMSLAAVIKDAEVLRDKNSVYTHTYIYTYIHIYTHTCKHIHVHAYAGHA
jgi:hypothetical protein